jgi:hypothetical protein
MPIVNCRKGIINRPYYGLFQYSRAINAHNLRFRASRQ